MSREALVLLDLFDLEHHKAAGKAVEPHLLRPVVAESKARQRIGNAGTRSPEEILAILRSLGHAV